MLGHKIRNIAPSSQTVTDVAGTGVAGSADGTVGTGLGQLDIPQGIAIGPDGYLYVADRENQRILKY